MNVRVRGNIFVAAFKLGLHRWLLSSNLAFLLQSGKYSAHCTVFGVNRLSYGLLKIGIAGFFIGSVLWTETMASALESIMVSEWNQVSKSYNNSVNIGVIGVGRERPLAPFCALPSSLSSLSSLFVVCGPFVCVVSFGFPPVRPLVAGSLVFYPPCNEILFHLCQKRKKKFPKREPLVHAVLV